MSFLDERADLDGRVAMVVGGGGGLGQACATDLGGAGMRLALCDKDPGALKSTASAIADAGAEVVTRELDARDPEALAAFFAQVDEHYGGRLDVLVNVVGGTFHQPFEESSPRGWDALIRTNFTWLLHATQMAIPRMSEEGGSIINITSIEGHRAAPGYAVYAAMKAGVTSLTRTLAVELAPRNIRINTIAPDYIPSPGLASLQVGTAESRALHHAIGTPMGREGTFEDAGGCALFLASRLSSFVTGTTLHPDGGAIASSGWFNWPDAGYLNHPPQSVLEHLLGT
ncbi:MAG TPA: SDR family oxidoreductase [Acidimicrobiales bacterium]|nr:SDR family oxidoreductase [Acidimicrobiales bacterium]